MTEQQASLDLLRAKYKKAASNSEDFELMHEKAKRQVCVRACVRACVGKRALDTSMSYVRGGGLTETDGPYQTGRHSLSLRDTRH